MNLPRIDLVYERQWSSLNNLVSTLIELDRMGRLYGGFPRFRYERAGIPSKLIRTFPVAALWNLATGKLGLPKRIRLDEPQMIGNWVARQADLSPIVMANGTAYRFLFPKLAGTGRALILERGSMHPEDYFLLPQRARAEAGYPHCEKLPASIRDEIAKTELAHFIIAGSEMVRESYVKRGFPADRVFTCHYGVDTTRLAFIRRDTPANRPLRVAAIGVIGFRKGLYRLLRLGEWAKRRQIPLEIWFAGPVENPEAHEMLSRSGANIRLLGVLRGQAFRDFLAQCDLCAVLSYEEGLPFALLESMSTGLPAIVSTDTGACEVPIDQVHGIQLTHFTDDEFDAKLRGLFSDPSALPVMGRLARQRIEDAFTTARYSRDIAAVLGIIADRADGKRSTFATG